MKMKRKEPTVVIALIPMIMLIVLLFLSVQVLKIDVHIPILAAGLFAALVGLCVLGIPWAEIEEGITDTIKTSMGAILILMVIGTVVSAWTQSGIVPVMIYYGLQILSPRVFLVASLLICSIVSLSTGACWGTIATMGIALMGIGSGLGIPEEMIAGAVISGSYFGDKMSPLSDTTNLAPAVAGSQLFDHIKHMLYTTLPAYIISLIVFVVLGMRFTGTEANTSNIAEITTVLESTFNLSPWLLLIVVATLVAVAFRLPAILVMFGSAVLSTVVAIVVQGVSITDAIVALHYGCEYSTGVAVVDELLSGGGLDGMMWTISMILCAMIFGGVMDRTGMLKVLVEALLSRAKSTGALIAATLSTCFLMNVFGGEQYLSIVIPGKMYKDSYREKGLAPRNLSRALEDAGTITSVLIPWNNCGVYVMAALGIGPWVYIPYCVMNWLTPIISMVYGFVGFSIMKIKDDPSATPEDRAHFAELEKKGLL